MDQPQRSRYRLADYFQEAREKEIEDQAKKPKDISWLRSPKREAARLIQEAQEKMKNGTSSN
jgi:hypothetical protein